ncbi:MAG: ComEC/Rec2 family competence protein [Spirochaetales bacterium]|uniref:ComEC/Rec2 family competence protein n=1 Tax=Candidatus Thalassospirochaeta sargassi TaxID=3119039 RepID=A0AAJ1IAA4_9SPIO|nr:ComEC/Rec2 family competence protein [Spirochaetales bacterium]
MEAFQTSARFVLSVVAVIAALSLALISGLISVKKRKKTEPRFIILMTGFAAGMFLSLFFSNSAPSWLGLPVSRVTGFECSAVSDSRRLSSGGYILEAELHSCRTMSNAEAGAGGRILLFFNNNPKLFRGCILSVEAEVIASEEWRALAGRQRLSSASILKNPAVLTSCPEPGAVSRGGWHSPAARWRSKLAAGIAEKCLDMGPEAGGLFSALFTGNRDGLTSEESRIFRRAGCSHILALSGMHLGIISGIILLLLKPLPGRKPAFCISCVFILAYLYLTGFGISLVRAAVMYFFCGYAMIFYRRFRGGDVLLLSFISLVLINPSSFYSPAFRLSFLAVAGILLVSPTVNRILRSFLPLPLSTVLSVSIGAQLFVTPLLVQLFGELYPAGILSAIIIAPLVTVFIWTGIIYLISDLGAAAFVEGILYRIVFSIAGKAAKLPAIAAAGRMPAVLAICAFVLTLLYIYSLHRRKTDGISHKL